VSGYRPGLDGLRAYLVLAVVLFHTRVPGFSGGWIGVDVFFALSGFLITSLLVDELDATGRISLRRFWARRSRRLMPALVGVVAFSVGLVALGAVTVEPSAVWGAVTYTTNWVHIVVPGNGYWDLFDAPDPFEHLWSLAVEEQFYLMWPLAVIALRRHGRRGVGIAALLLASMSLVLQVVGATAGWSIDRLYQGTDTRALPFLLGALVACVGLDRVAATSRRAVGVVAVGGALTWLIWSTITLDGTSRAIYYGPLQAVSLAGVVLVVAAAGSRHVLLCHPAVRAIGLWSYGIYLFHWPLAVATPPDWWWPIRTAVVVVGSTTLAALSYRFVESPVRAGVVRGRQLVPTTAALVGLAAVALAVAVPPNNGAQHARAEVAVDWAIVSVPDVVADAATDARQMAPSGEPATAPTPRRVLVIGDSTANVFAHGLETTGRFEVVDGGMWGCPLVEVAEVRPAPGLERSADYCPDLAQQIAAVELVAPDVLVAVASAPEVWDHRYASGPWVSPGDEAWIAAHDQHLAALVAAHPGLPVVIVPAPDWRPPSPDALETSDRRAEWNGQIDRWVATHGNVVTMGYAQYLPRPGTAVDSVMRPDGAHLTKTAIAALAREHLADDLVRAYRAAIGGQSSTR
jgi:peptidoglycan/LPS O-acetylase OafA/YrhL